MDSRTGIWGAWLQRTIKILASGYVLFYYSEIVFWARIKTEDTLQTITGGWLLYSFAAWIVLAMMAHFRVNSFPGFLSLAACLAG
ncbi:MAG: hypothetical protein JXA25_14330 [Anaerolineales bacterium]|nr:hypothetical protein [Anaerolineales bacterium]